MEERPPSVFKPLSRLFTNEREREFEETRALYAWCKSRQQQFTETKETIGQAIYDKFFADLPDQVSTALCHAMYDLLTAERYIWELPPPSFERMSMKEFTEYRNLLYQKQYFFQNQEALKNLLIEGVVRTLYGLVRELPVLEDPSPFTIPLAYALPNTPLLVEQTYGTLANGQYFDRGMFRPTTDQLYRNICLASGRDADEPNSKKPIKYPTASELPPNKLVDTYLGGTAYQHIFETSVPLKLTHRDRFSHMHVLGGSGAGKTSLIENLILHDLGTPDPPSIVVIDPHSDLINRLVHADIGLENQLIYINPRDTEHPVAINIFALNQERLARYDATTREQVTAGVIQTFDFLFSSLFDLDLSGKQQVFFRYVTRLMLSLPDTMGRNATILDMLSLMQDPTPYLPAIQALPPIQREFFERDFMSKTFAQTKEQIRYRLQGIVENPTLARLFTSSETKVDFFTELNRGAVILIDTAKDFLKDGSSIFGQICISLILQAIQERAAIAERDRKATFIYIDEAADVFGSNIDDLLTDARKFKAGLILSHQYLDQASSSLRASLAANTGSKFVSGVSAGDARAMASELRTTPDFILSQPQLQFAAHIRNVTPHALSIPITPGLISKLPRMPEDAFERLMTRNHTRVSLSAPTTPPEPVSPTVAEEDSREW